jgi:hypothetical protein
MADSAITIFTTPKPFIGHFGLIQRNALASWRALTPSPEIILFGNEQGAAEAAAEVGAIHVPGVRRNEEGTPLISAMFEEAQRRATNTVVCYSNADIILMQDVIEAVKIVEQHSKSYLLTGRRYDMGVHTYIDFGDPVQVEELKRAVVEHGEKYPPLGMDYFIFRRGTLLNLPDFAVGRPRWDNYMLYYARKYGYLVIDATDAILAVHQNHDYSHHPQGMEGVWEGKEAQDNLSMAGGWNYVFTLRNSTHTMGVTGLRKASISLTRYERLNAYSALNKWARTPIAAVRRIRQLVRDQKSSG